MCAIRHPGGTTTAARAHPNPSRLTRSAAPDLCPDAQGGGWFVTKEEQLMNSIIYLIGVIVVIIAVLSFLGMA